MKISKIIFYDSECIQCNSFIRYAHKNSKKKDLYFSSLDSNQLNLIKDHALYEKGKNTLYYLRNGVLYKRSRAIFQIHRELKFPYKIISLLRYLPEVMTDFFYIRFAYQRKQSQNCELNFLNEEIRKFIID
jgi:predicted DCC family thiol-disulfide oxidoreductase YuxK